MSLKYVAPVATAGDETSSKRRDSGQRVAIPKSVIEEWVEVGGHRIRYLKGGNGPALLLVHGLMGYSFSWSENLDALTRKFTVYAPDFLNRGYSERVPEIHTLQQSVGSVLGFMKSAEIDECDLLGTSHGGAVAMMMAVQEPERFRRMVLVAPANPWSEGTRWQARFFSTWLGIFVAPLVFRMPKFVRAHYIARMYADRRRMLAGTVESYDAPLQIPRTTDYLLRVMACWFEDFRRLKEQLASGVAVPTLFLWGDSDPIVPYEHETELRECFSRSEFQVMNDAGHLPYEEWPEEFNRRVMEYLGRDLTAKSDELTAARAREAV